jgi:hypothetical protein
MGFLGALVREAAAAALFSAAAFALYVSLPSFAFD